MDAARRLQRWVRPTPLTPALALSADLGCEVWIKNETVSPIASFKLRGALTDMLRRIDQGEVRGFVAASTGNHGQGVAYSARLLGRQAHVFLPAVNNPAKRRMIQLAGATLHQREEDLDAARAEAIAFAAAEGYHFVDDGESAAVIEGAGTVGLEIAAELDGIDLIFAPMGSGSLASGIAIALQRQPRCRVIAVQSAEAPAMVESFHARAPVARPANTVAEGLVCQSPAKLALATLIQFASDAMTVPDQQILRAVRDCLEQAHILVEPAGAAALAAAQERRDQLRGRRVVLIASGSNIAPEVLRSALRSR